VSCSYCGKVIGAFRLLRDSEFCCDLHRRRYGDRLGKALHEMAAPEPAPAGIAGFFDAMPYQPGNRATTLIPWQTIGAWDRIRPRADWSLTIDARHDTGGAAAVGECDPVEVPRHSERRKPGEGTAPARRCDRWMPIPAAEPVATFVQTSAALAPAHTPRALRLAGLEPTAFLDVAPHAPARCYNCMPVPSPESVAAFVAACAALAPAHTPRVLRFPGLEPAAFQDRAPYAPVRCDNWMPVPAPEPVAAFVAACAALARVETPRVLRFATELDPIPLLDLAPETLPVCENWIPVPAAEPVAAFVQTSAAPTPAYGPRTLHFTAELEPAPPDASLAARNLSMPGFAPADACGAPADPAEPVYALEVERHAAPPRMPGPELIAELEPIPMLDVPLTPPAICQRWMPVPAADPVFSYLRPSFAPAVAAAPRMKAPAFGISTAAPRVARAERTQPVPPAAESMAGVQPNALQAPPEWIHPAAAMALPDIPQAAQEFFAAAQPAATPLPEAVEQVPVAAQANEPVSMAHAPLHREDLGAPPEFLDAALAMGEAVASPAPDALESMLVASVAAPMAPAASVRLLPFMQTLSQETALPSIDVRRLTPEVRQPAAAGPRLVAPQPIATLAVTPPAIGQRRVEPGLPSPGLLPIEYHSQRLRHAPAGSPEWRTARPAILPPPFLLSAALEKFEEPAPAPKAPRPGFGKLRTMPAAKRPPSVLMVAGRVAAGFLLAASLWVGVANFREDRRLIARDEVSSGDVVVTPADRAGAARAPGGTPAQPAPTGPVAWVKGTIAHRATLKISDAFRGMENWDGEAKARPAGWTRHPDGYVNTGALALFHPSLKFTDYRLEFFGQIETKSIGWTVRAADTMNYHAMKVTVMEAGMRPFVALVQYNVVGGKAGRQTHTPLNVMVHNNRPMQFAVDVRGNRMVTSIDGEEVDSSIDNTLVAGGVGFFSEAGERARLYWMRVSRNDDWLGHVCAMLADGAAEGSTAELRGPGLPGGTPLPGLPGGGGGITLAGVWIAMPYPRATRKVGFFRSWRSEPWNMQAVATRAVRPCRQA
jgi:hypothetical protein